MGNKGFLVWSWCTDECQLVAYIWYTEVVWWLEWHGFNSMQHMMMSPVNQVRQWSLSNNLQLRFWMSLCEQSFLHLWINSTYVHSRSLKSLLCTNVWIIDHLDRVYVVFGVVCSSWVRVMEKAEWRSWMRIFSEIEKKQSKKVLKTDIIVLFVYLKPLQYCQGWWLEWRLRLGLTVFGS